MKSQQKVLITGATSGLGLEFAQLAHDAGWQLLLTGRNAKALDELQGKYASARTHIADLSTDEGLASLLSWITDQPLDALINNAGFGLGRDIVVSKQSVLDDMLAVNIKALVTLSRTAAIGMIKRGTGQILNVASTAAFMPGPHLATYYASKAFVLSFSEAMHHELKGSGVTCTTLCPGPTKTEFFARAKMEGVQLEKGGLISMMSAKSVAKAGWRSMLAGRRRVIPGLMNALAPRLARLLPRNWQLAVVGALQQSKQS
jgi:short-subunit dehydrogenase